MAMIEDVKKTIEEDGITGFTVVRYDPGGDRPFRYKVFGALPGGGYAQTNYARVLARLYGQFYSNGLSYMTWRMFQNIGPTLRADFPELMVWEV